MSPWLLPLIPALVAPADAAIVDRIAAVVNKEVITLSEVYDLGGEYIEQFAVGEGADGSKRRQAELEVLDSLIQRALVRQQVDALGLAVTRDELDRAIDDVARQNGLTREQLRMEVERSGLPWTLYRDELEENLRQMKFNQVVIYPRIAVSKDEVKDLYNRRIKTLGSSERTLEGIMVAWPADATVDDKAALAQQLAEARSQMVSGEVAWTELVGTMPPEWGAQLLPLGAFAQGEAVVEIDGPAFRLGVGQVSEPIALPSGLMLLKVVSETQQEAPPLEGVRADLEMEIQEQKTEAELELWTVQARRQASVEIMLDAN